MPSIAALQVLTRPEDRLIITALSRQLMPHLLSDLAGQLAFDWAYCLDQSQQQGVCALLAAPLRQHLPALPADLREAFQQELRGNSLTNLAYIRESVRISTALAAVHIPALFYKGVTLAHLLYAQLGERSLVDMDILVAPQQIRAAKQALVDLGYTAYADEEHRRYQRDDADRSYQGYDLYQDEGFVAVDLQERFGIRYSAFRLDFGELWARRQPLNLGGQVLNTLSFHDSALTLSAHGAQHRWSHLKWVVDIARLLERDDVDWQAVRVHAHQLQAMRMVGVGLLLAEACCDVPLPPAWQDIRSNAAMNTLAMNTLGWMFRPVETLTDLSQRADYDFGFDLAMRPNLYHKAQIARFLFQRRLLRRSDDDATARYITPFRVLVRPITLWQRYGRSKKERVE